MTNLIILRGPSASGKSTVAKLLKRTFENNTAYLDFDVFRDDFLNKQDEYYKLTSSEQTTLITDDTRTKQLKSFDPFKNSQPADFFDSDHMFGASEGFAVVIGNPPYFQLQKNKAVTEWG